MRNFVVAVAALLCTSAASTQTLNMMNSIDAPHYDAQCTTWGPTYDIDASF
jgi:peptide/nickel transport system substrate-binding protein